MGLGLNLSTLYNIIFSGENLSIYLIGIKLVCKKARDCYSIQTLIFSLPWNKSALKATPLLFLICHFWSEVEHDFRAFVIGLFSLLFWPYCFRLSFDPQTMHFSLIIKEKFPFQTLVCKIEGGVR